MTDKKTNHSIIFDLDGTLIDSLKGIAAAMNKTLSQAGYPEHQEDEYRQMVGDGISWLITRALPEQAREPKRIIDFIDRYRRAYEEVWPQTSLPFPGIVDLLQTLQENGIPYSILSNKSHDVTLRMTAALFPTASFHTVLGQREGYPIKPDPSCALRLCRAMGSSVESSYFVGDSGVDMKTAVNAGMIPIGVDWGMRSRQELVDAGAQTVLSEAHKIWDWHCQRIVGCVKA